MHHADQPWSAVGSCDLADFGEWCVHLVPGGLVTLVAFYMYYHLEFLLTA